MNHMNRISRAYISGKGCENTWKCSSRGPVVKGKERSWLFNDTQPLHRRLFSTWCKWSQISFKKTFGSSCFSGDLHDAVTALFQQASAPWILPALPGAWVTALGRVTAHCHVHFHDNLCVNMEVLWFSHRLYIIQNTAVFSTYHYHVNWITGKSYWKED